MVQVSDKTALVKAVKTHLPGCVPSVIFDVGANNGSTAISLAASFPEATVYAFEPVAETYRTLVQNTSTHRRVRPFNLALGAQPRRARVRKPVSVLSRPENNRHASFESVKSYLERFGYRLFLIYDQTYDIPLSGRAVLRRCDVAFVSAKAARGVPR